MDDITKNMIKSSDDMVRKMRAIVPELRAIGYGGIAVGGVCLVLAILSAVRENYDVMAIEGLIGGVNVGVGIAELKHAKRVHNNARRLIESKRALEQQK